MDPTLPRINTIKCPNQACKSNEEHEHKETLRPRSESKKSKSGSSGSAASASPEELAGEDVGAVDADVAEEQGGGGGGAGGATTDREIIYLRYDDINMNFVYLCPVCDSVWNTSQ